MVASADPNESWCEPAPNGSGGLREAGAPALALSGWGAAPSEWKRRGE